MILFAGSQTLHHWQRLATPHLGGIFEHRPGVKIRGEAKIKQFEEKVSLDDFEEDEGKILNFFSRSTHKMSSFSHNQIKNLFKTRYLYGIKEYLVLFHVCRVESNIMKSFQNLNKNLLKSVYKTILWANMHSKAFFPQLYSS